jgi:hypothetical protein
MTLEQASLVAQIVSAIAVIASLVFVGFQLRSAAAAIRASSSQAHSSSYTQLVQSIINNEDFARIWSAGIGDPNSLKEEEWVRFVAYASALSGCMKHRASNGSMGGWMTSIGTPSSSRPRASATCPAWMLHGEYEATGSLHRSGRGSKA